MDSDNALWFDLTTSEFAVSAAGIATDEEDAREPEDPEQEVGDAVEDDEDEGEVEAEQ